MAKCRILIAEDHAILREGLKALMNLEADFEVVGEATNGLEALQLAGKTNPDILLLDLSMPHANGTESISKIKRRYPNIKIIVLTMHKAEEYIRTAFKYGASGYMLKDDDQQELIRAIRNVLSGNTHLSPSICDKVVGGYLGDTDKSGQSSCSDVLTLREREVIKLIAEGYRNKDIAEFLSISHKTVEKHRSNLMRKLKLNNASALTTYAIQNGLIENPL